MGSVYSFAFTASGSPAPIRSVVGGVARWIGVGFGWVVERVTVGVGQLRVLGAGVEQRGVGGGRPVHDRRRPTAPVHSTAPSTSARAGFPYSFQFTADGAPRARLLGGRRRPAAWSDPQPVWAAERQTDRRRVVHFQRRGDEPGRFDHRRAVHHQRLRRRRSLRPGRTPAWDGRTAYDYQVEVSGYPRPTISLVSGTLPTGLTLSAGGRVSGTPTEAGHFSFHLRATNSEGTSRVRPYSVDIQSAPALAIRTTALPRPRSDMATRRRLPPPVARRRTAGPWSAASSRPVWRSRRATARSAVCHRTPGRYTLTVKVTDAAGHGARARLTLAVAPSVITISPAALPGARIGPRYSITMTAHGGSGPYHFVIASGSLPGGCRWRVRGTITGRPSVSGSFPITVVATDRYGYTGTTHLVLNISGGQVRGPAPACPRPSRAKLGPEAPGTSCSSPRTQHATCGNVLRILRK